MAPPSESEPSSPLRPSSPLGEAARGILSPLSEAAAAIGLEGSSSSSSSTEDDTKPHCTCHRAGATCFVFATVFSTTAALNIGVVLLTSSITEVGVWFYDFVADEETADLGWWLRKFAFSGGGFCLAVVYLLDMRRWNKGYLRAVFKAFMVLATFVFALGILFATPQFPEIPFFYGILAIIMTSNAWRWLVLVPMGIKRKAFYDGSALAYIVASVVLFGVWLAWLMWPDNPAFSERVTATFAEDGSAIDRKTAWILLCSPAALAVAHLIMASFVWMRGRFGHHQDPGSVDLAIEVKISVMVLVFLGVAGYIAAILGATDMTIGKLVMTYTGIMFLLVFLYLVRWVGLKRLELMAKEHSAVQTAAGIVTNDWVKALVVLLGPPVLLAFVVVEWIHQCCRMRLHRCGILDSTEGETVGARRCTWLTWEADILLHDGRDFFLGDTTSVLTKAIYCAIGIVSIKALGSTFIWIFLQWVNLYLARLPLGLCLLVVFVVVLLLFLFPPISGQVIYGFAGYVIAPKFGWYGTKGAPPGYGFLTGVVVSSTLCLLGKLVASTIQMKCIGGLGANSVFVKRSIGVHTNFMKAFRYVLTRPGCSPGKVAILTFGQDFATSVLTGILDLPLVPMLVGTLPVIVVIVPCCFAFAYTARAADDVEYAAQHKAFAGLNLLLSGIVAAAGNAGIWYYVQEALQANQHELDRPGSEWMADPLEPQVLASIADAVIDEQKWSSTTRWDRLPCPVRSCLGLGLGLSTVTVYTMLQPVHLPFERFKAGDQFSKLPGGTPLGAVTWPLGWLVVLSTATLVVLATAFTLWGRRAVASVRDDGDSGL